MITIQILRFAKSNCKYTNVCFANQYAIKNCCYRFCHVSPKNNYEEYGTLLENILGCSNEECVAILNNHKFPNNLDNTRLQRAADILQKFDITKEDIRKSPRVLTIQPTTIEHHSMVLQEGGFQNVNVTLVLKYFSWVKMRVSFIKARGLISPDTDVASSFLSHCDCALPNIVSLPLWIAQEGDEKTFFNVHEAVLKYFLTWRLDMTPKDIDRVLKTYPRVRHKSFRLMNKTLHILENELGFSKEKICKNGYLIHSHPDNILNTLHTFKTLGGIDVKTVLSKYPKIIMTSTNTLIKTSKYLKEFNIADKAIQRCLHVFTLGSESVRLRLLELKTIPEFHALASHPRVVRLVHYQRKAKSRLDHLQELRVRCASLHILSATRARFERYAREGEDRTRGTDVTFYLASELGVSESILRSVLVRHPFWRHVPLVAIRATLDHLLALGYNCNDVLPNIHILLYPWDRVEQELKKLTANKELTVEQLLLPPVLPGDHRLALCLYFIERAHHFTGDGIWTTQPQSDTDTIVVDRKAVLPQKVTQ